MRIGFVTQYFPPEGGSLIAAGIADGLAARGHTVDVLTGFPNYPSGVLHPDYPLERYRRDERSERVTVHRAPLYASHDSNAIRRSANYLSFGISASWIARSKLQRPDVWLTYLSPPTSAFPVLTVPRRLRAPSYQLIIDLWPESFSDSGFVTGRVQRAIAGAAGAFCKYTYRRSSGIAIPSPGMREVLVERGVPRECILDIPNYLPDDHLLPHVTPSVGLRRELGLPTSGRMFMFAGNMGAVQCLEPLVEAFARVPEVNLVMIGDGIVRADLERYVADRAIGNVHFVGMQPPTRIGAFIAASDVQIVSLNDTPLLRITTPSKVQAAIAAGRPVFVHAAGDVADLITRNGAGLAVTPGDPDRVAACIREFAALPDEAVTEMGRRSRALYEAEFTADVLLDRLEQMMSPAAGGRSRRLIRQRSGADRHMDLEAAGGRK